MTTTQPVLRAVTAKGEKITLRPAELRDAEAITIACQDEQSTTYTTIPLGYTREHALGFINEYAPGWWERGDGASYVIADSIDDYVGQIDLRIGNDREIADVGFLTSPYARGKGYMPAALRVLAEWGLRELGLSRVEWKAFVGNEGSRRVAEKAGFQYEGVLRSACPYRGERRDAWIGALTKEDLA